MSKELFQRRDATIALDDVPEPIHRGLRLTCCAAGRVRECSFPDPKKRQGKMLASAEIKPSAPICRTRRAMPSLAPKTFSRPWNRSSQL